MISDSDRIWWARAGERDEEDPRAGAKLKVVLDAICQDQSRRREMLVWGAMYAGGMPVRNNGASEYTRAAPNNGGQRLSLNVTRSVVDAVVARIFSKSEPHVSVQTVGGGYEEQDHAKRLELGIDGAQRKTEYYEKSVAKGRDACVWGTGILRIRPNYDEENVDVLRLYPWDVILDDGETASNANCQWEGARSIYMRYFIDKGVLMHRMQMRVEKDMPERGWFCDGNDDEVAHKLDQVERMSPWRDKDAEFGYSQTANQVVISEAWHRPSGKGAKDGRYVMMVGDWDWPLIDRPLDEYESEFSWYTWGPPIAGFYGQGLVELGSGIQAEINKLLREIQQGHHLIRGHWMVENGSKVLLSHINNDLSTILKYTGTPPQYIAPAVIAPEVYSHLWNLVQKYYEMSGVNQQAAQAQRPVGLDSGEAQRVYADQQTETLLEKGKRFEKTVEKDGMLIAKAAKALSKHGAYNVRTEADDAFENIDWKTLKEPDDFVMYVETTSALPGTLAGKLSAAQDLLQLGVFKPMQIVKMVGLGDLLQLEEEVLASRKLIERRGGEMLRGEGVYAPEPYWNLPECVELWTEMLLIAERKETDESRLAVLRNAIELAKNLIKQATPPPPAPMGTGAPPMPTPGGAPAPGAPMPPPGANGVMQT